MCRALGCLLLCFLFFACTRKDPLTPVSSIVNPGNGNGGYGGEEKHRRKLKEGQDILASHATAASRGYRSDELGAELSSDDGTWVRNYFATYGADLAAQARRASEGFVVFVETVRDIPEIGDEVDPDSNAVTHCPLPVGSPDAVEAIRVYLTRHTMEKSLPEVIETFAHELFHVINQCALKDSDQLNGKNVGTYASIAPRSLIHFGDQRPYGVAVMGDIDRPIFYTGLNENIAEDESGYGTITSWDHMEKPVSGMMAGDSLNNAWACSNQTGYLSATIPQSLASSPNGYLLSFLTKGNVNSGTFKIQVGEMGIKFHGTDDLYGIFVTGLSGNFGKLDSLLHDDQVREIGVVLRDYPEIYVDGVKQTAVLIGSPSWYGNFSYPSSDREVKVSCAGDTSFPDVKFDEVVVMKNDGLSSAAYFWRLHQLRLKLSQ